MDPLYNRKIKSLKENIPTINTQLNIDSALIRYLRSGSPTAGSDVLCSPVIKYHYSSNTDSGSSSGNSRGRGGSVSPLSAVENLERKRTRTSALFGTPVKAVEEDVLVMDGILVESAPSERVSRTASPSDLSLSLSSPGYKDICRAWRDSRHCSFGFESQFAHGKEQRHPIYFPFKNKSESHMCKPDASPGSCIYGPTCGCVHQNMTETEVATSQTALPMKPEQANKSPPNTIQPMHYSKVPNFPMQHEYTFKFPIITTEPENSTHLAPFEPKQFNTSTIRISCNDYWSPQDDGIKVVLPSHIDKTPSRKNVNAYIHNMLYGPTTKSRLPVFAEFCPEK